MAEWAPNAMTRNLGGFLVCMLCAAVAPAFAAQAAPPDFAPTSKTGWIAYGTDFIAPLSGPPPVTFDPQHPFIPDPIEYNQARPELKGPEESTFRVADLDNPILQPWAKDELRKVNARVLSGTPVFTRQSSCWPIGVPGFVLYPVQPVYFIQTPKEVLLTWQSENISRHAYMNVAHSAHVTPSWFGESVGHYEGDALVVDTIGMNGKTYVDNYRTPHTAKLHVVERFHIIEGGKTLEVNVHVEDPGAFTMPWNAIQHYRHVEIGPMIEVSCAENNTNYFHQDIDPIPQAATPDF